MEKKLNILFLTARFPYPLVGGDRLKPYHIISYLAKKHNVTLVSFHQGDNLPQESILAINELGVEQHVIPLSPLKAGLNATSKLFKYPLEIGYYYQKNFQKKVDKLCAEKNFDIGFSFFMRTAEYLKNKNIKKVLMAEDCRTLYQLRSYENSKSLKQKLIRYWEYKLLKKYEPNIVNYFDAVTLVTHEDIHAMKQQNYEANYNLLSNGTDIHYFKPQEVEQRKGILFAGKLDIWANELMIKKIINHILPLIHEELPDTELNIVGANPPASVLALKGDKVKIIPDVPDMQPYLQKAQLFLHPHAGGSGIQNKLLEAMASGCPVVTTATGNQGINAIHGKELMIGDSNEELAKNAIRILSDRTFALRLSKNAREAIVREHSWEHVYIDLDKIIYEVLKVQN